MKNNDAAAPERRFRSFALAGFVSLELALLALLLVSPQPLARALALTAAGLVAGLGWLLRRSYVYQLQQTSKAANLLREAVSSVAQGFTLYDENDRLVQCNEAYLRFYATSRDLVVPGATFEQLVRAGALRGQYREAIGRVDEWVQERVRQHQSANGEVIEQQLDDGRWLLIVEYRTPSGYIVGNRIDITALKATQASLHQRELYLRATLDNLPFLFWLKDADSRFLTVNKAFSDACGRANPADLVGLTDLDVWPTELAQAYRADDFAVMRSRLEKSLEEPVAGSSGASWLETYKKPVIAVDGTVFGTVGFARDISARKQMEQALIANEQRWELVVSSTNDGIWDWNPRTGEAYFSKRWKDMLGYADDEIGNQIEEWAERVHPDDLASTMAQVQQHLSGETDFYQCEHRMRCKDGSYKWILDRGRALKDANGQPLRMLGSHADVTERRQAEARAREHAEQLKAIFDLSPDGFVTFDAARHVKYISPAFQSLTHLSECELVGCHETEFSRKLAQLCRSDAGFPGMVALRQVHRQHASQVSAPAAAASSAKPLRHLRITLAQPGARVLEVRLRESQSEAVSQILYVRDITYETEVERMKSEFLSTAAHELRTPMASIYGFAEVLLTQEFDATTRQELLNTIFRQSALMASILNELLDLARIEARQGKDFVFAPNPLQALVRHVVAGFKLPAGRRPPTLALPETPALVMADATKAQQAILNVLSNAYKYSQPDGQVTLSVQHRADGAAVCIADNGMGMNPGQVSRVGERFYRADTSGKVSGTGLGMSIVREIMDLHQGHIHIDSTPGQGTRVTLVFAVVPVHHKAV